MGYENPVFTMHVDLANAAFDDIDTAIELARILDRVALQLRRQEDAGACMDANGNRVGEWAIRAGRAAPPRIGLNDMVSFNINEATELLFELLEPDVIAAWSDEMVGAAGLVLAVAKKRRETP